MLTKLLTLMASLALVVQATAADTLRVMTWNVQRGARYFDDGAEKTVQMIRQSKADVVLMQESNQNEHIGEKLGPWVAKKLGWEFYQGDSHHLCILSRYPIAETYYHSSSHGVGAKIRFQEGKEFLVWSCWLDYRFNVGQRMIDKPESTVEQLLACESQESTRLKETRELLAHLKKIGHLDAKMPLLVGGDWNCPSHLDYTEAAKDLHGGRVLLLPCSLAMENEGFVDAYRRIYPDARKHAGHTWSPLQKKSESGKPEAQGRIDRIYLRNGVLHPTSARIFPEVEEEESIPQAKRQFPSDHAALLIEWEWPE